jgi:outer membrane protein assembly factor BamB
MPRSRASHVYVGIKTHVVALDRKTGEEVWRSPLPAKFRSAASLVTVVRDAEGLFATCAGEIFALDPRDGTLLWHNPLKGLGSGLTTAATDLGVAGGVSAQAAAIAQARAAQAAATSAAM